ncbi:MAG: hypothetical protein DRJ03_00950 [Chloroflexi bacterium]|nr:MAG: hypothetical protein DRJ03_00950 [Chloroflexota bacterium]
MTPEQKICVECQECCKWLVFYLDKETLAFYKEVYETRGCEINANALFVNAPCQHLTKDGCAIYEHRPIYCRTYNGRLDPAMMGKCKLEPARPNLPCLDCGKPHPQTEACNGQNNRGPDN